MELREHPLMRYQGVSNWPPVWTWVGGECDSNPEGEVGILKEVNESRLPSRSRSSDRVLFSDRVVFVLMEYERSEYLGCLPFDDPDFCRQIQRLLTKLRRLPISHIGRLDVSHTFYQ